MKLTGAQIILKKLVKNNINIVFEFPGGSICPILDELYKYKKIKTVCFRHEQAAIHAADAYARITKKPSVCMATSGPGASNLVTGIANAYMDSVPIVVITGQVAEWDMKKDRNVRQRGFQELDIVSVVKSITKAAILCTDLSRLGELIDKAFFLAQEGRPGPVLIDVPINVQYTATEYKEKKLVLKEKKLPCSRKDIREIAKKLIESEKPIVIAGGGVVISDACKELRQLLDKYRIPVCETLMGITSVPADYKYNLGMTGYAGSQACHTAVKEADFVLGLGVRFDNRAFPDANRDFSSRAYIIHIDCDKHELNHRVKVKKAVLSDIKPFLNALSKGLSGKRIKTKKEWLKRVKQLKQETAKNKDAKHKLTPAYILQKLSVLLKNKEALVTTDVGQHQLWAAQYFKFSEPNSLLTSGGLGTMGFGLPAAIGAQFAKPKAPIFQITSDGSLQMNIQELATVEDYRLPIKIILLNNKCLGLVRQIQEFAFCKRYASTQLNSKIDFVKIARAYGIDAFLVNKPHDVENALKKIAASKRSMLVDFRINEFENVYPVRIKGRIIYEPGKP